MKKGTAKEGSAQNVKRVKKELAETKKKKAKKAPLADKAENNKNSSGMKNKTQKRPYKKRITPTNPPAPLQDSSKKISPPSPRKRSVSPSAPSSHVPSLPSSLPPRSSNETKVIEDGWRVELRAVSRGYEYKVDIGLAPYQECPLMERESEIDLQLVTHSPGWWFLSPDSVDVEVGS